MIVKLDFERVYPVNVRDGNENEGFFYTRLRSGREKKIAIRISSTPHELVDDAYNLAFGPVDRRGRIKDMESLQHADYSIVFSTILNFAKGYIDRRPGGIIGLDGSTNSRAYLYFRIIRENYDYLSKYFTMYGAKYYVRVKRKGTELYENPFDFNDMKAMPVKFNKAGMESNRELETMFNYFIFTKKTSDLWNEQ